MKFESVYRQPYYTALLYDLLSERTPEQSISHKQMPTMEEHISFIHSMPYLHWYVIKVKNQVVGAIYLSKQREIGISIFKEYRGKRYGERAVKKLMKLHPGRFLANVNPNNIASVKLFELKLSGKIIQVTYEL